MTASVSVVGRVASLALALSTAGAAQVPAAPRLPPEKSIPLDLAVEAARAALDDCAARGSPATVEIVDLNGLTKAVLSADGAPTNSFDYARRKAYTVLRKGMSSGDYGRSLGTPTPPPPFEGDADLIQYAGALPIRRGGTLIGAIAVSGPAGQRSDEACARAGLDRIAGRLDGRAS